MTIKEIMTSPVITVSEKDLVVDIAQILSRNRIHGVPVLDGKIPIGIVTESDFFTKGDINIYLPSYIEMIKNEEIVKKFSSKEKEHIEKLSHASAKDIMSSPCITINQNANVDDFTKIIKEKNFNTIPVVDDDGSLVGIASLYDVINLIKV
jgi:CBS domain-containing protein